MLLVLMEVAKQHDKGVLQKDLHLGNFMLSGAKVFAIDPAEIRFLGQPLSREQSISQLALLSGYFPLEDLTSIAELGKNYFAARGWVFENADRDLLLKQIKLCKTKWIEKTLKKSLRTGKKYQRIKTNDYVAVFDRNFCQNTNAEDFIKQTDALMDKGVVLKNGNSCYVSAVTWNNQRVVIKRYNHLGLIHSLRHTIKGSRARQGWLYGHRLRFLNIATPKPVAYIEHRKNLLIWDCYLVTEYVEGQKLYDFLKSSSISTGEKMTVIQKVVELLEKLSKNFITHGDLKHTNILLSDNGPVLTDLDGMKVHKFKWTWRYKQTKDIKRFEKAACNYNDVAGIVEVFTKRLAES
jgi:tRNA A-37 threonylcarbamoyl transferase component Bud32